MLALVLLIGVVSCSNDDNSNDQAKYNTKVYITDGPIDNADVQAVFVTIADVQLDGTSLSGFTKTTVNLTALQNGNTQLLGNLDLAAQSFTNLTLVLSTDSDATGNSPANYVLTESNAKIALATTTGALVINSSYEIVADAENKLVIDFDLRKAIVTDASNGGYNFASQAQLQNSLRVVNTLKAGTVTGTATNNTGNNDNVTIAYAYNKGTFTSSESNENSSSVRFANAITSSVATGVNNQFGLYFLHEGNYEVHFASYEDTNNDGNLEFAGMINAEAGVNLNLLDIAVTSNTEVNLQVVLMAIMPL